MFDLLSTERDWSVGECHRTAVLSVQLLAEYFGGGIQVWRPQAFRVGIRLLGGLRKWTWDGWQLLKLTRVLSLNCLESFELVRRTIPQFNPPDFLGKAVQIHFKY